MAAAEEVGECFHRGVWSMFLLAVVFEEFLHQSYMFMWKQWSVSLIELLHSSHFTRSLNTEPPVDPQSS